MALWHETLHIFKHCQIHWFFIFNMFVHLNFKYKVKQPERCSECSLMQIFYELTLRFYSECHFSCIKIGKRTDEIIPINYPA